MFIRIFSLIPHNIAGTITFFALNLLVDLIATHNVDAMHHLKLILMFLFLRRIFFYVFFIVFRSDSLWEKIDLFLRKIYSKIKEQTNKLRISFLIGLTSMQNRYIVSNSHGHTNLIFDLYIFLSLLCFASFFFN